MSDSITRNEEGYFVGGWRIDMEDFDTLEKTSDETVLSKVEGLYAEPEEIDPRPTHQVENQGQQGACGGKANSSVGERAFNIAAGKVQQFSSQFCYIEAQRLDGLIGRDVGSTIVSHETLARTKGYPLYEFWKYDGTYHTSPKGGTLAACYADAKTRLIRTTVALRSYQEVKTFLSAGLGGVILGITWNASMHSKGVIESYNPNLTGGGHAIAFLGYSRRVDASGRKYLWLCNSWGQNWGQKGWAEVAPAAVDSMFKSRYTVMRGLSDLAGDGVQPRPVDFSKDSPLFD